MFKPENDLCLHWKHNGCTQKNPRGKRYQHCVPSRCIKYKMRRTVQIVEAVPEVNHPHLKAGGHVPWGISKRDLEYQKESVILYGGSNFTRGNMTKEILKQINRLRIYHNSERLPDECMCKVCQRYRDARWNLYFMNKQGELLQMRFFELGEPETFAQSHNIEQYVILKDLGY